MIRDKKPIHEAEVWLPEILIDTGIAYGVQFRGCVPFYEEYDAMVNANYNENDWAALLPIQRAFAVAHFRIQKYIKLHEGDAVEMSRKSK